MGKPDTEEEEAAAAADSENVTWQNLPGVPSELEAHFRNRPWAGKEYWIKIYLLVPYPDSPNREKALFKKRVESAELNGEDVDDFWLQREKFYGKYRTMLFWKDGKRDVRMCSGTWEVTDPNEKPTATTVTPVKPLASPGGTPPGGEAVNMPTREALRREFLGEILLLKEILAPAGAGGAPGAPPAGSGDPDFYEKSYERRMRRLEEIEGRMIDKMYANRAPAPAVKEEKGDTPKWLSDLAGEFMPKIKKWINRLIADDENAVDLRAEILDHPKFREIWGDAEKKIKAAQTFIDALGDPGAALVAYLEKEFQK